MRLLEKYHVEQTFFDGAQLNYYITNNSSGRVFGLDISYTSQQLLISAGLLIVRGYRVSFGNEILISYDAYPASNETQNLILRITVTQDDSSAIITTGTITAMDDIDNGVGTYDHLLCTYTVGANGIIEVNSQIRNISRGTSNGGVNQTETVNLSESALVTYMATLTDGVYIVNTQMSGDEFLFIQKNGQQIGRYNGVGESYQWNADNQGWVMAAGAGGGGTHWISGTLITGTGSNILSYNTTLYGQANMDDIYLNTITQNTYTCIYKDQEKTGWKYEGSIKGLTGDSVHIRYSNYQDGTGFTTTWNNSQPYMGIAIGQTAPTLKSGYTWTKFIGNYVEIAEDETSTLISYTIVDNADKTFIANSISSLAITIPAQMYHGFYSGVNMKTSSIPTALTFINNSDYTLKLLQFGVNVENYTPMTNKAVNLAFFCDGIYIYCYINEV